MISDFSKGPKPQLQGANIAAIVDLDGTLYDGYIWQALTRHHLRHQFKLINLFVYLFPHLLLLPIFRLGWISTDFFYRIWGENMAWLVRNVTFAKGGEIWDWLISEEIVPNLRPEVMTAIKMHKKQGHLVILLSGTFQPLLQEMVERLDLDAAVGTPLAVKNGRYLGKIVQPLNIGEGKVKRLITFSKMMDFAIDLQEAFFYTNSIVDLPVMERVGKPVAVYPDNELAHLAAERGWTIIGDHKTTP